MTEEAPSPDDLAESTGADPDKIKEEYKAAAELAGIEEPPKSAADPRPGGEPWYRSSTCDNENCNEKLVLEDSLSDDQRRQSEALQDPEFYDDTYVWHDAWVCPSCLDGIYMDWPEEEFEELQRRAEEEEFVSLEELEEELGLEDEEGG